MQINSAVIKQLEEIAEVLPAPIYWMDTNSTILGINTCFLKAMGASHLDEVIGKTPYDLYPEKLAEHIVKHNEEVMTKGIPLSQEESIQDIQTGKMRHYTASKSPLRDENGKIIGLVGSSIEVTAEKEAETLKLEALRKANVLKHLELLAPLFPIPVYWNDLDSMVLGVNEHLLSAVGATSLKGKTPYDMYPKEIAEHIVKHNKEIIHTGQILSQEEPIKDMSTGRMRYYDAFKAPLRDEDGKIIGTLGISIETTSKKEAEKLSFENDRLKFENETQKTISQEQEKFRKLAGQVAHDIRSPLASLLMLAKICQTLPETERIALREAANNIGDIANNLLSNYQKKEAEHDQASTIEERESILVSPLLLQILTEKKYQYPNRSVKLDHHFSQAGNFAWFKIEPTAFKRMLSNIINNSVDAFDQKEGKITLFLDADDSHVHITIEDNGKGMNPELVEKILSRVVVTEGKENGHGIGLTQVRETLENNQGEWVIDSRIDQGTKFVLTFPRVQSLNWIAETLQLNDDDTVVILDDDTSIHMAWNLRFEAIKKKFPHLIIKHFELGQEAIDFINDHAPDKKQKIFLLADYELLKQDLNGLDVIKKTQISRSILVTSHYADKQVQQSAAQTNTKILPKQLASDIDIEIGKAAPDEIIAILSNEVKEVDVVFVDDDQRLLDSFTFFAFNKKVATYQDPRHFLDNVNQYPKDTKIMLDNHFANYDRKGIQIAEQLHALGFTQLYLLSGESFSKCEVPNYLTAIMKTDLDQVEAILNK